ncbi:MAG TPA: SUMF1/EgtB/PvdO family nonheme iron enzyme [Labilithrix sp.]|nr:SUMF1/EgtB/PvdO family nonheme iron enzyme [Labilithrix sp.]
MTRARVLSVIFVATTWLLLAAPRAESDALAGPTTMIEEDAASREAWPTSDAASDAASDTTIEAAATRGPCPEDMVEISGKYCPELVQQCLAWLPNEQGGVDRCAQFAPSEPCKTTPVKKHFCIDRFEFPNRRGQRPVVMKTWIEAQDTCRAAGKRLCGDTEWTLACEGSRRLPYPYGRKRDAQACNIDRTLLQVDEKAIADPKRSTAEVARLWQGEPSGSRARCTSPYGVYDMTGNVDEWVVNESSKPFRSGSKGGYWGPVRARCRPMTTAHGETFPFYQTGFRCCADPEPRPTRR